MVIQGVLLVISGDDGDPLVGNPLILGLAGNQNRASSFQVFFEGMNLNFKRARINTSLRYRGYSTNDRAE